MLAQSVESGLGRRPLVADLRCRCPHGFPRRSGGVRASTAWRDLSWFGGVQVDGKRQAGTLQVRRMKTTPSSSLGEDVKNLAGKSFIYGLGSVLLRSINVLMLPLYTRFLTPADYGIVAVTSALTAFLSIVLPLSLYSA